MVDLLHGKIYKNYTKEREIKQKNTTLPMNNYTKSINCHHTPQIIDRIV